MSKSTHFSDLKRNTLTHFKGTNFKSSRDSSNAKSKQANNMTKNSSFKKVVQLLKEDNPEGLQKIIVVYQHTKTFMKTFLT